MNPTLRAGHIAVVLGTAAQPFDASAYFIERVRSALSAESQFVVAGFWSKDVGTEQRLRVRGEPGDVYALVWLDPTMFAGVANIKVKALPVIQLAQSDAQGVVRFRTPHTRLRFTARPEDLNSDRPYASEDTFPAVLLKVNPQLHPEGGAPYQVVPPGQFEATR